MAVASRMRLRNKSKLIAEDNNLQYTKLKDTEGSVLKTFSKRGRTNVGHLINPPTRYKFDHTVALESIIEEGVENSPINWNELRRKAQESKKLLFKQVFFSLFRMKLSLFLQRKWLIT